VIPPARPAASGLRNRRERTCFGRGRWLAPGAPWCWSPPAGCQWRAGLRRYEDRARLRGRGSPADSEAPDPGGRDNNDDAGCFSGGESWCRRPLSQAISGWTSGSRLRTGRRLPGRRPVSSQYTTPFEFTSGSAHHVVPERSDEPFRGLERHLATAFRQRLSQNSGPGRAGSLDSKHMREAAGPA
jgi:hypothetical protein